MKLKELNIKNFRCFEDYSISFAPGCTVLFGKNGAGKSCLIQAIRNACSFIFSNEKVFEGHFIAGGIPELKIKNFISSDFYFDNTTRKIADYASLGGVATFCDKELTWELRRPSKSSGRLQYSLYKKAFFDFAECVENGATRPLLVYFSDSFPHRKAKIAEEMYPYTSGVAIPYGVGYYQWSLESACTSFWESRICNLQNVIIPMLHSGDLNAINNDPAYREVKFVSDTLSNFSKKLPGDYIIRSISPMLESLSWHINFWFDKADSTILQRLPAGYRRLFSIVLEIASRWFILNGNESTPEGIVIIDEIDLHLHPELEQTVISALTSTFPKIQFIFSTHSPLVISNIELQDGNNRIYKMTGHSSEPILMDNIYGLDYDSSVSEAMDVTSRISDIDNLIESYLILKEENEIELMNDIFEQLTKLTCDENEAKRLIDNAQKQ